MHSPEIRTPQKLQETIKSREETFTSTAKQQPQFPEVFKLHMLNAHQILRGKLPRDWLLPSKPQTHKDLHVVPAALAELVQALISIIEKSREEPGKLLYCHHDIITHSVLSSNQSATKQQVTLQQACEIRCHLSQSIALDAVNTSQRHDKSTEEGDNKLSEDNQPYILNKILPLRNLRGAPCRNLSPGCKHYCCYTGSFPTKEAQYQTQTIIRKDNPALHTHPTAFHTLDVAVMHLQDASVQHTN